MWSPQQILSLAAPVTLPILSWTSNLQPYLEPVLSILTPSPAITLPQGTYKGTVLRDTFPAPIDAFLGIPYAQPPLGDLRFRAAAPLPLSNETYSAKSYGFICPGKQLLPSFAVPMDEDCMTLNVFRPKINGTKKVPVAVYIHGGAFNRGSSRMHNTASQVAWSDEPFIAVSFNYRIGALGFLPSTLTHKEGIVNLGLRDQVFVLEWVQENIEAFGGDPEDVTIYGLSAGAHSIGHHLMNYESKPLFHKVIIESGAPTSRAVHPYNAPVHEEQFAHFVEKANCSGIPEHDIMSCLRAQPSEVVTNSSFEVFAEYNPSLRWAFQPAIDGDLIKRRPIDAWVSGKWNKVPIMTGHTTNEGSYYVPPNLNTSADFTSFFHTLLPQLTSSDLKTLNKLYPDPSKDPKSPYLETRNISVGAQFKRVEQAYAHYAYSCPVRQTAEFAAPDPMVPVYLYQWATNRTVRNGANHADNMYYETHDADIVEFSETQAELVGTLHAYVTSFITRGEPNGLQGRWKDRPHWGEYKVGGKAMVLGKGNDERAGGENKGVVAQMDDGKTLKKECKFWWKETYNTEE